MIEVLSLLIVLAIVKLFGGPGIAVTVALLFAWQIIYRIKYGHWMQGIDHKL